MKKNFLTILTCFIATCVFGQSQIPPDDIDFRSKVIDEINRDFEERATALNTSIAAIEENVIRLNNSISNTNSAVKKAEILQKVVNQIEEKQAKLEEETISKYEENYKSALVNLGFMHHDIKPLTLFTATKDFFGELEAVSDPMSYDGYTTWYKTFSDYVDREKKKDANLNLLSSLLTFSGGLASGAPLAGPIVDPLFSGIASFINSLGSRKNVLKVESQEMFLLTAKLAQFTHDKNLINSQWGTITEELDEVNRQYGEILKKTLDNLEINPSDFNNNFTKVKDWNANVNYVNNVLSGKIKDKVSKERSQYPKEWKDNVHYYLMDVQTLKIRFGQLTLQIKENLNSYETLISKYKTDPDIGDKVNELQKGLDRLRSTFDAAYDPAEQMKAAIRMYKVI